MTLILVLSATIFHANADTLQSVIILARHGARTPTHDDDPLKSLDPWLYDGSLTGVGMRQLFTLGRLLRMLYIETEEVSLIPDNYDPKKVKVYCSNTMRTIQSAEALMLGLYPKDKRVQLELTPKQVPKARPPMSVDHLKEIERELGC